MRYLSVSTLLVTLVLSASAAVSGTALGQDPADSHPGLNLIPWPKSIQIGEGRLRLSADSRVVASDAALRPLAEILIDEIRLATGLKLTVASEPSRAGDIVLRLDPDLRADQPLLAIQRRQIVRTTDGAHRVVVDDRATVSGFDYRATAEGTATLLQLLGQRTDVVDLPRLTINDWPHADYCGVMLDVARQYHSLDDIRQVVRLCRLYKARYLQLHLTDDQGWTFPSTKYPQLGSKNYGAHGGKAPRVYPLDELRQLVAFADARGVTLVPEFEMPGHSGAASRSLPEVFDAIDPQSKQPVGMGCMNMSNEAIYPALDTILGEICDVFRSSPFVHIGSDEVSSGRLALHSGYAAFMRKHGLKDDHQLADHFIREMCAIVKRHGRKAIKWEGLSNYATDDVIIMAWEGNSALSNEALARGYTTITCPWNLAVPWDQWNMYRCNASQLKPGDSVLGATLVAWEQPPTTHIPNLRKLPTRQERTWGPDNRVTDAGFAARFQPLDALAGRLLAMPPKPNVPATISTTLATRDLLVPEFALDADDATFYQSVDPPKAGDHFTIVLAEPRLVYGFEVLTGVNGRGLANGAVVQGSSDGNRFSTEVPLRAGGASADLSEHRLKALRIQFPQAYDEPFVLRSINLRLMIELEGDVSNPTQKVGPGNVAVTKGNTRLVYPIGQCDVPIMNQGHTLILDNGGNAYNYSGLIAGKGQVELFAGGASAPLVLDGKGPNALVGTWFVKSGHVMLAKPVGTNAMSHDVIVAGQGSDDGLIWTQAEQIDDDARVELRSSQRGGGFLRLNGHHETIGRLTLSSDCRVWTDGSQGGGVLDVSELVVDGKPLPRGIYTSAEPWLVGSGMVVVGDVKRVEVAGAVADPRKVVGAGNIAMLTAPTTFTLGEGETSLGVAIGTHSLSLSARGPARFLGFITGHGGVRIEAPPIGADGAPQLEIGGASSSSYQGPTVLARGVVKLNKPAHAVAIPGALTLGGSAPENRGDGVIWGAAGQVAPSAIVTVVGGQPAFVDLAGQQVTIQKLILSKAGKLRTGDAGRLNVRQLFVANERLADGRYAAPQPWLEGTGSVEVNSRVDVQGIVGSPESSIGAGNIGNLTGDTKIAYPSSGCDMDIVTNGFTLTFDSGDGNAMAYSGSVSGTGNVELFMGPSYTGFKDAPLRLAGTRPNSSTGKFLVRKGRVQLEKPAGVDAISGDAVVGGQGFNDCLFWMHNDQIKDTSNLTLLDAGNSGPAYLHLNGCRDTVATLTMTARNKIHTDSTTGAAGVLTVSSLVIGDQRQPAGEYSAANSDWIEGRGQVIVKNAK